MLPVIKITPSSPDDPHPPTIIPTNDSRRLKSISGNSLMTDKIHKKNGLKYLKCANNECWNKLGLIAILLILVMFVLDVLTLTISLKQITIYEVYEQLLEHLKFHLDYSGSLTKTDFNLIKNKYIALIDENNFINYSQVNKQLLIEKLNTLNKEKMALIGVIVITLTALAIHFIGFIGVLRKSFTLTLFETIFLMVLLTLKPILWWRNDRLTWILIILHGACWPLFLIYQIRLYYVKIRKSCPNITEE